MSYDHSAKIPIICKKCGHPAGYHLMKSCVLDAGYGKNKKLCDCDGWERDDFKDFKKFFGEGEQD